MDKSTLRVTYLSKGVAWLELIRANQMNTFTPTQYHEVTDAINALNKDPSCTVLVISAYGKLFTAGTDIHSIVGGLDTKFPDQATEHAHWLEVLQSQAGNLVRAMLDFEKILIYAPHAGCVGFGTTISQLADFVLCSTDTWFSTPFMGLNFCAEGCSSYTFPRILGPQMAKQMLLGQKKLKADEALQYNFVTKVFPVDSFKRDVLSFAAKFAMFEQDTLKLTKQLIAKHDKKILHETNNIELDHLAQCFASPAAKKSLKAFVAAQMRKKKQQQQAKLEKSGTSNQRLDETKAQSGHHTERIDKMINNIGGWSVPPPPPGSVADMKTSLHVNTTTPSSGSALLGKSMPTSQSIAIDGQRLQQNKRTQNVNENDDDTPINLNIRQKPPQETRPFEPIPPLLL